MNYEADIYILDGRGASMDKEKFTLKTNLGLNLAGESNPDKKDMNIPDQLYINGQSMDLSGTSQMNIYTLDGVRSPMGAAPLGTDITELIYDVEVSVYEEGAAGRNFPDEERMIVIEGSKTN